ncbi:MAG: FAD-dependent oxidoreductase [Clostridium fessum]
MILATGSSPVIPDIPGIDLPQVMTSRDILRMDDWNFDCLTVIGGGVIGVEIATIFAALGSRVTLLEQANRLLESMDPMISEQMEANLRSKGIEVHCNVQVMEIKDRGNDTVSVNYRCERGWKESPADRVLVAVGRRPNMSKVLADDCQVQLENGRPLIKGTYRTTQENALCDRRYRGAETSCPCGSVPCGLSGRKPGGTRTPDAAFGRAERYVCRASGCADLVCYTEPEIAAVGFTENDARLYNMKIKCGVAYMTENGKALLARNSRGFVRLIFEAYTNTLIGAQIMCARATDMIGEMATAIANGLTAYQLRRRCARIRRTVRRSRRRSKMR